MDSRRFGRVLGIGTRLAARTLVDAAEAATAPNPASGTTRPSGPLAGSTAETPARSSPSRDDRPRITPGGVVQGSRQFGQAVWRPFVRLSGVLWLELTGVFFGLFALFGAIGAWKLRGSLVRTPENATEHTHLLLAALMALLFGYFCISSFLKASRRGRQGR